MILIEIKACFHQHHGYQFLSLCTIFYTHDQYITYTGEMEYFRFNFYGINIQPVFNDHVVFATAPAKRPVLLLCHQITGSKPFTG